MSKAIVTVFYSKQCDAYHKAVARHDWVAANLLYLPPVYKTPEQIRSEIKTRDLIDSFEYEMDRIENMDPRLLEVESEMKLGI